MVDVGKNIGAANTIGNAIGAQGLDKVGQGILGKINGILGDALRSDKLSTDSQVVSALGEQRTQPGALTTLAA
jgi:hypothetical protein